MRRKFFTLIILLVVLSTNNLWASPTDVHAAIDSLVLMIGEQATVTVSAIQPADESIVWPSIEDFDAEKLELVEEPKADTTILDNGDLKIKVSYLVTAFDSAFIYIPGLPVVSGEDTVFTDPLTLKVMDVPVDTTQNAITDIKNVYKPPFDWVGFFTIVAYVLLGLLVVALIVWLVWRLAKSHDDKTDDADTEPVDPRQAHEIALEELELLRRKQLWQEGRNKEYHTEITEILRRYIQRRFDISAMEITSDELMDELRNYSFFKDKKDEIVILSNILSLADLVKFAKFFPLASDNENVMRKAVDFVEATKTPDQQVAGQSVPEDATKKSEMKEN